MKVTIKFDDGREAKIELTPEQVRVINNTPLITRENYCIWSSLQGLGVGVGKIVPNPLHTFKAKEHADLLRDRFNLEMELFRWASEMNEGWVPDWSDKFTTKYGIVQYSMGEPLDINSRNTVTDFLFGLSFKSKEIAEQAKEIFGGRILSIYGKQF